MSNAVSSKVVGSIWNPFHHRTYVVIWTATVASNIGTWMYSAAAGWLMTELSVDPLMVSLVQVATSLPLLLFALPAGALADIVDKRHLLIFGESATSSYRWCSLHWFGSTSSPRSRY